MVRKTSQDRQSTRCLIPSLPQSCGTTARVKHQKHIISTDKQMAYKSYLGIISCEIM